MSGCVKRTTARYTSETRTSPSIPAKECVGQVRRGNDGNWYEPSEDKNGRFYWKQVGSQDERKPSPSCSSGRVASGRVASGKKRGRSASPKRAQSPKRAATPKKRACSPKKAAVAAPAVQCDTDKCIRRTSVYYQSRNMPPFDAEECPDEERQGNDGRLYRSEFNESLGIYKWYLTKRACGASSSSSTPTLSTRSTSSPATVSGTAARRYVPTEIATGSDEKSDEQMLAAFRAPSAVVRKPLPALPAGRTPLPPPLPSSSKSRSPVIYEQLPALAATDASSDTASKEYTTSNYDYIAGGNDASFIVPAGESIVIAADTSSPRVFGSEFFDKDAAVKIVWAAPVNGSTLLIRTPQGLPLIATPLSVWRRLRQQAGLSDRPDAQVKLFEPQGANKTMVLESDGSTFLIGPADESSAPQDVLDGLRVRL